MTTDKYTALHALHEQQGARMVSFAGYSMPVQFTDGIISEHKHTREGVGLFDVSHMGQFRFRGDDVAVALESCIPVDIVGLKPGRQRYGFLTNDAGGIIDDLMIANTGDSILVVANAARKDIDYDWFTSRIGDRVKIERLEHSSLIALQGPEAHEVLSRYSSAASRMRFMDSLPMLIADIDCHVSRSGYTGEDGYEISVPSQHCESLARALLESDSVKPIGLGARDSLRLEAGLCLYGQDIDEDTSPIEAGLGWAISRARRTDGDRCGGFPGADRILSELANGPKRTRVGIQVDGRAPLRNGVKLLNENGAATGEITSGSFGASANAPVSMGYVATELAVPGTALLAEVRDKQKHCVVCELPFVPHRYVRK